MFCKQSILLIATWPSVPTTKHEHRIIHTGAILYEIINEMFINIFEQKFGDLIKKSHCALSIEVGVSRRKRIEMEYVRNASEISCSYKNNACVHNEITCLYQS